MDYKGIYTESYQIPVEERQGTYVHRRENNWDYSGVDEWDEYVPTDFERAMVTRNKKQQKRRASDTYHLSPVSMRDAMEEILYTALDKGLESQKPPGPRHNFSGMTTRASGILSFDTYDIPVEGPKAAGHVPFVNVRALKGGVGRPNDVELAKHDSIQQGFDLMFPEPALRAYMKDFLDGPLLRRDHEFIKTHELDLYDLNSKMDAFVDALLTDKDVSSDESFPVRDDAADQRRMLDRNRTKNPDNVHERNLSAIAKFIVDKPEYVTALFLWSYALTEYSRDLKNTVRQMTPNAMKALIELRAWDTVGLIQGRAPRQFSGLYDKDIPNIDRGNKLIPVMGPNSFLYIAPVATAIMGALLEKSGVTAENAHEQDIDPAIYKEALDALSRSGIFQRGVKTPEDKPVLIRCPFATRVEPWLTLDLGENGKPEDQALAVIVKKVRGELQDPNYNLTKRITHYAQERIKRKLYATFERNQKSRSAVAAPVLG